VAHVIRAFGDASWRVTLCAAVILALVGRTVRAEAHRPDNGRSDEESAPRMERYEPWPLRPDPTPGWEEARCPAGAHYLLRIGGLALRLGSGIRWSATPVERPPPTWMSDLPDCGDGRAIRVRWLELELASVTGLPRKCWVTGVPPGPDGPACASTPEGLSAGRRFFALGLPGNIAFYEQAELTTLSGEDARLRGKTIVRRTALGNEEFRAPLRNRPASSGGWPTYRLPRIGEGAEALGPLLVECFTGRWPNPDGPGRVAAPHVCAVSFHLSAADVRVTYRFQREIYDEPDWQALDLRVRKWTAARATDGSLR
jgi:hypothetical protein